MFARTLLLQGMPHLRDEIDRDMALLGIRTLADMRQERLMDARAMDKTI